MPARKLIKAAAATLVAGAAITGSLLAAGAANATDNATFLEHVHALGFSGGANGDTALVNAGVKFCAMLDSGVPLSTAQALAENVLTPKGYSVSDVDHFVAYTISDLC